MKKRITQKVLATLTVACLFVGGAWAQTDVPGDGANFATNWATGGDAHVIEGTSIPLFAMPDSYFHPDYDPAAATPDYTLTAGFTWHWTVPGGLTLGLANDREDNYTTIAADAGSAAGSPYTVTVQETAPLAWGACTDAGQTVNVIVHTTPDATFAAAANIVGCESDMPTDFNITVSGGWQNYWLAWTLQISSVDNLGAVTYYNAAKADQGATPMFAIERTTTAPDKTFTTAGGGNYSVYSQITGGFTAIGGESTTYTFILNSINDRALRFSNFATKDGVVAPNNTFTYNDISETRTVTVHPTPVTGPIYHINNTWAD